jgi:hypothetical protein
MVVTVKDDTREHELLPHNTLPASQDKEIGDKSEQLVFDSGIKAWLQVLGAFFLWFNSWFVILYNTSSQYLIFD